MQGPTGANKQETTHPKSTARGCIDTKNLLVDRKKKHDKNLELQGKQQHGVSYINTTDRDDYCTDRARHSLLASSFHRSLLLLLPSPSPDQIPENIPLWMAAGSRGHTGQSSTFLSPLNIGHALNILLALLTI